MRERLAKLALEVICRTRLDALAARLVAPRGVIFALHRVKPAERRSFSPNSPLEVTPEFLEAAIATTRSLGFRFVALDEVPAILAAKSGERFAVITLDDAYRDNKVFALPVFRRQGTPFTIFVPDQFVDGIGQMWWTELEMAVRAADTLTPPDGPGAGKLTCRTKAEKYRAFHRIYWHLRTLDEDVARAYVRTACAEAYVDASKLCRNLIMTWDELREVAAEPLASFGAHTSGHYALAKLPLERARAEMVQSRQRIEDELGRPCRHFCYPYGDEASAGSREFDLARDLGFATAVTMQKSLIEPRHAAMPTALPRCSLNGDYQDQRYVRALLSGMPFLIWHLSQVLSGGGRVRLPAPPAMATGRGAA